MDVLRYSITTQRAGTNGLITAINRMETVALRDPAKGSTHLLYVRWSGNRSGSYFAEVTEWIR